MAATSSSRPISLLVLACVIAATCLAESDGSENYLYNVLPFEESDPVIDFEPPASNEFYNANGEDLALKPDFLYSTSQTHRVVLFYLPYCPHCQAYVPSYISLARRVQEMIQSQNNIAENVEFYAVSCLPNKQVCQDQHVGAIPGIKIFRAGSVEGVPADPLKLHPFQIIRILGIPWGGSDDWTVVPKAEKRPLKGSPLLGRAKYSNNKQKIYKDAYKSFKFALENEISMEKRPLTEKSQNSLGNWLLLLQNVLPPAWGAMHELLQELTMNFDAIAKDKSKLQSILEKHTPESEKWTHSCSHGKDGHGYTCGLWKLMTIAMIGVVEFNENAVARNEQALYHTADVARTLRDYIDHFFACSVCRTGFIQSFDSCAHDRCRRLVDEPGEERDWIELPLWLWQEHNAVSLRLAEERTQTKLQKEEEEAAKWPPYLVCPNCWISDSSFFNREVTFEFLRETYWPGVSRTKEQRKILFGSDVDLLHASSDDTVLAIPYALLLIPLMGPACLLVMCCRQRYEKQQSGRHKKLDL